MPRPVLLPGARARGRAGVVVCCDDATRRTDRARSGCRGHGCAAAVHVAPCQVHHRGAAEGRSLQRCVLWRGRTASARGSAGPPPTCPLSLPALRNLTNNRGTVHPGPCLLLSGNRHPVHNPRGETRRGRGKDARDDPPAQRRAESASPPQVRVCRCQRPRLARTLAQHVRTGQPAHNLITAPSHTLHLPPMPSLCPLVGPPRCRNGVRRSNIELSDAGAISEADPQVCITHAHRPRSSSVLASPPYNTSLQCADLEHCPVLSPLCSVPHQSSTQLFPFRITPFGILNTRSFRVQHHTPHQPPVRSSALRLSSRACAQIARALQRLGLSKGLDVPKTSEGVGAAARNLAQGILDVTFPIESRQNSCRPKP